MSFNIAILYNFSFSIQRGLTPFMIASCHGHKGVVRMLIEAKANVNQQTKV